MLSDKQQRFVDEYLIDLNATQAATRAGYSAHTANEQGARLLAKVSVRAAVEEGKAKIAKKLEVTQEYVLSTIVNTVERCRQSEMVTDRKGEPILTETPEGGLAAAYTFNAAGVLKGAELLGRHLGMFTEKHEITGKDGGDIKIKLSDRQRAQKLAFILARGRSSS